MSWDVVALELAIERVWGGLDTKPRPLYLSLGGRLVTQDRVWQYPKAECIGHFTSGIKLDDFRKLVFAEVEDMRRAG